MSTGLATGSAVFIATPVGLLGGGFLCDYLTRHGAHMRLLVCAVSVAYGAVCSLAYPLLPDPSTAAACSWMRMFTRRSASGMRSEFLLQPAERTDILVALNCYHERTRESAS